MTSAIGSRTEYAFLALRAKSGHRYSAHVRSASDAHDGHRDLRVHRRAHGRSRPNRARHVAARPLSFFRALNGPAGRGACASSACLRGLLRSRRALGARGCAAVDTACARSAARCPSIMSCKPGGDLRADWERVRQAMSQCSARASTCDRVEAPRRALRVAFGFRLSQCARNGRTGELCFLDFEYAGWDDPAKMVADFFCQPAVPVADASTSTISLPRPCLLGRRAGLASARARCCCRCIR